MKKLLSILAVALCFVACQNDQSFDAVKGDLVTATLNVAAPQLDVTRAGSDKDANAGTNSAFGAIDFAEGDAEFWGKYDLRYIFEVRSAEENVLVHKEVKTFENYQSTTLEFRAVPNREYNIYAYADFVEQGSQDDLHYNTADLSNITVDGLNAMDEAYDAYFAAETFKITTAFTESITLKRFLSKVRVITTDLEWLTDYADPKTVEVTFYNHDLFQSFNLYKGKVNTVVANTTHRYDLKKDYYNLGYDSREDAMTLFTTYLYASPEETSINFRMSTYDTKDRLIKANDFSTEIPIRRNWLTTIVGDVLTTSANITVKIDDNFVDEYVVGVKDGQFDSVPVTTLATPEVSAEVEGNVVTLKWNAVENAAQYGITVGTEMPVFVEETTYVFTGFYDTEYTFNVVAVPADENEFAASAVASVTVTTEPEPAQEPEEFKQLSVADFLNAAEDDTTLYELTGVITRVANTTYGNFDLTDETGTIYIYGLCSPEGEQKYWAASGAKLGDTITVRTIRSSFNGEPQGKNALFVGLTPFVEEASEWGVVGDLTNWAAGSDIPMYTTWKGKELFVAYDVEITSGSFKVRANNQWNDAKNYGLEAAGKIYADAYYSVVTGGGSQNITPMVHGTYDVYFDLANQRVALVTPGEEYADATNGGAPIVVIEGLKNHAWGLVGSFNGWAIANCIPATIDGDWAVVKNVTLANGDEFKFAADNSWDLSYGSGSDVNVGETYNTYEDGGNMKFVGEAGAYNFYFSMVDAKFYMETYIAATTVSAVMADFGFANAALVETVKVDDNVTLTFEKGGASTAPAYYTSGSAVRLYQNGAIMTVDANGRTITSIEITFANNMYYVAADSGELTEEAAVRTWTGSADAVKFTCTGTDKNHRAYVSAIKVTYE